MNSYLNGSPNIKEIIDKDKLIIKIFKNIESKTKIIEKYKNKYFNSNNILDIILLGKLEFLEILNDFEEIISQSLQGMRSLFAEIRNLKEKNKIEEKIIKRRNHKLSYNLNSNKTYSTYINNNANNSQINQEQNEKKFIPSNEPKDSLYITYNKYKNNMKKCNYTKLYYKKSPHYNSKTSNNIQRELKEYQNKYDNETKNNNTRNSYMEKTYNIKSNNYNSVDLMENKDILTYDLSLNNDFGKVNQNLIQSSFLVNNNNNYNNFNDTLNNKVRKILRLELKKKAKNRNNINMNKNDKNNSMSQKYELELENTEISKNEKIEVEIKYPIRQGIKNNCRKKSAEVECSKNY